MNVMMGLMHNDECKGLHVRDPTVSVHKCQPHPNKPSRSASNRFIGR